MQPLHNKAQVSKTVFIHAKGEQYHEPDSRKNVSRIPAGEQHG